MLAWVVTVKMACHWVLSMLTGASKVKWTDSEQAVQA
jgi:hypothetical protein